MKKLLFIFLILNQTLSAQHKSKLVVAIDHDKKVLTVNQQLTFFNQTNDTLTNIVLNDWMNGYSSKNTPLAARFSDEFERGFHLAKEKERGRTSDIAIVDETQSAYTWERDENHPDVIQIRLKEKLLPNQKITIVLSYKVKIPNDKFTKYGYSDNGQFYLKNCFLVPARYDNHGFVKYDNLNLDDCANALSDYDIEINVPQNFNLHSDLNEVQKESNTGSNNYHLTGEKRLDFTLFLDDKKDFEIYKNGDIEIVSNLKDNRLNEIQRALVVDRIVSYVNENLGKFQHGKVTVAQADYDRNPFYGLNQLPFFISPFPDEFMYEIKFLKTYLNNYLHNTLQLDPRKDNWIYDGIQVYIMMKYIEEFHPDTKMMGGVAKLRLLRGYNLVSLDFNGQYSYLYMLMARKNLDQPLGNPKNTLIKFNEKIASKYRAGLSLRYLDSYLQNHVVQNSIQQFLEMNKNQQTNRKDFENLLTTNSPKKINWFFDKIIDSRDIIDYKFDQVTRTKDSIRFSLKNKTSTNVPISIYGIKGKEIVYKKWFDTIATDSIYSIPRNNADKIVINYKNEVPEFNLRNNWRSLHGFRLNNRPIKFNFMKDLEDPYYNQILYVPTLEYNLYDGFLPGLRFHNRTILDKPFIFDLNPTISTKTQNLSGKGFMYINQYNRDSNLYNIRYSLTGHYLHYAPDAYYTKLAPTVTLFFRPDDFRDNRKQALSIKEVIVDKQATAFTVSENSENYQVFNVKYNNSKTEVTKHFSFLGDFQYSTYFGKLATEVQYRKLFDNNRSINLRFFAGTFLHNKTTSNYFDFGLDRPSDYLFESDYLGRSETKGIYSQQSIVSDGFFKSKLETRTANQWMVTTNANYTIWGWIDGYGDIGFIKNKDSAPKFVYDSGIRLNLVTDYFELFFPVYSNNGWEIGDKNYGEKIRFIITFRPETLINLFTRKWF
ncbi:aminopeptidase [Flavobacterium sp. N1994]|uniref:aminopeptidase n=1 Tax=Flavobacterium sp. N1994 TaxID=2986827 RepID=UPI0022234475|nr:aminopeptidase [Flavobacterium sp. N1994]